MSVESKILITYKGIGKSSMYFSCFCHSKYHQSITPPLQWDFLDDVYFFLMEIYSSYIFFTSWHLRRIKSTLVIWNIAGKCYNWSNFIWIKNMKCNKRNYLAQSKFPFLSILWCSFDPMVNWVHCLPHITVFCWFVCLLS